MRSEAKGPSRAAMLRVSTRRSSPPATPSPPAIAARVFSTSSSRLDAWWLSAYGSGGSNASESVAWYAIAGLPITAASTAVVHPTWISASHAISHGTTLPSFATLALGRSFASSRQNSWSSVGWGRIRIV